MSGHTPGPWVIVQGDEWTTDIATVEGELPDGSPSHWTVASVNRRRDEWEQNRRLIAAAPELLEACRTFLWAMRTSGASNGAIRSAEDAARAAIAKARGEQP